MGRRKNPQLELLPARTYAGRKLARPLSPGKWHHLILGSGKPILRMYRRQVYQILRRAQLKFGVELKAVAVMENHCHFCIRFPSRACFANFLRMFTGQLAQRITSGKLWVKPAWSRIISVRKDLLGVIRYIEANPIVAGCFDGDDVVQIRGGVLVPP